MNKKKHFAYHQAQLSPNLFIHHPLEHWVWVNTTEEMILLLHHKISYLIE